MQPGRHPVWMDFHIPDLNMSSLFVSSPHSVINKICVTTNESVCFVIGCVWTVCQRYLG